MIIKSFNSCKQNQAARASQAHRHGQQDTRLIRGVHRRKLDDRTCSAAGRADPAVNVLRDDRCRCSAGVGVGILIPVVSEDDKSFATFGCRTGRCKMSCAG